jgi:hypothetical protein
VGKTYCPDVVDEIPELTGATGTSGSAMAIEKTFTARKSCDRDSDI